MKADIPEDRGPADLERVIKELKEVIEGHKMLHEESRKEIQMLKENSYELEKCRNLLQGYKTVIIDLSTRLNKK